MWGNYCLNDVDRQTDRKEGRVLFVNSRIIQFQRVVKGTEKMSHREMWRAEDEARRRRGWLALGWISFHKTRIVSPEVLSSKVKSAV